MMNKTTYIRAVLVVFWLLILTRIPAFINGNLDPVTVVSTVVELTFFVWGIVLLRNQAGTQPANPHSRNNEAIEAKTNA